MVKVKKYIYFRIVSLKVKSKTERVKVERGLWNLMKKHKTATFWLWFFFLFFLNAYYVY